MTTKGKRGWLNKNKGLAAYEWHACAEDGGDGTFTITDCHRTITLDFDLDGYGTYKKWLKKSDKIRNEKTVNKNLERCVKKINVLVNALEEFRDNLEETAAEEIDYINSLPETKPKK